MQSIYVFRRQGAGGEGNSVWVGGTATAFRINIKPSIRKSADSLSLSHSLTHLRPHYVA